MSTHLELIPPESQSLNEISHAVSVDEFTSTETRELIAGMFLVAKGLQSDAQKPTMVGLAAPQLGLHKRVILVDVTATGSGSEPLLRVYINPVIVSHSPDYEIGREGCFSTSSICGVVPRFREVTIEAFDEEGNRLNETHTGFTARIFQHEIDHLDGVRFPDRITDDANLHWVEPNAFGAYRERWSEWDVRCDRETWERLKKGDKL